MAEQQLAEMYERVVEPHQTVYAPTLVTRTITAQVVTLTLAIDRTWELAGGSAVFSGILTANGAGLPGETVAIFVEIPGAFPPVFWIGETVTDGAGNFSVVLTLPWEIAGHPVAGYTRTFTAAHSPSGEWSASVPLAVAFPARISGFTAPDTVTPGAAFTTSGTLEYQTGSDTTPGAWLALAGKTVDILYDTTLLGSAVTAADGSFSLSVTIPTSGTYILTAQFAGEDIPAMSAASAEVSVGVGVVPEVDVPLIAAAALVIVDVALVLAYAATQISQQ